MAYTPSSATPFDQSSTRQLWSEGAQSVELFSTEPETDLEGSGLRGVRSVDHIAADIHSKVAANGAGLGLEGLGGTDQLAGTGDHAIAFQTIATTGPEVMKSTRPAKKGRSLWTP